MFWVSTMNRINKLQPILPSTCELLCYGHSHTQTHATTDGIERDNDVWFLNCKFMILSANLIASITKVWTCDRIVCMCHLLGYWESCDNRVSSSGKSFCYFESLNTTCQGVYFISWWVWYKFSNLTD